MLRPAVPSCVSMTVDFQSYGREASGHWNTGNCLTPARGGYVRRARRDHPE